MHQRIGHLLLAVLLFVTVLGTVSQAQDSANTTSDTTASTGCAPPLYGCARSDLITTHNLNPPPNVSKGKNALVTPSDFNLPIVRITDGTLYENRTFTETPSGSNGDNVFNVDDTYMVVIDQEGWRYPISFNPSIMQIENSRPWNIAANQQRWTGSTSFSRVSPNIVFAVMGQTSISGAKPNKTTLMRVSLTGTTSIAATAKPEFDFAKCPGMPDPYDTGRGVWRSTLTGSAWDKRFSVALSNRGGQGTGGDVVVYDSSSGECYRYDTLHARLCTKSACVPMSLPDEYTVHEVYMSLDGDYLRIVLAKCLKGGCHEGSGSNPYFWQVGTTNVVRCYSPKEALNCTGHQVEGYGHIYNAVDWPITAKRSFSDPFSYTILNPAPLLTPITDSHYSNNDANVEDTNPIWATNMQNVHTAFDGKGCETSGNVYEGCTFPGPLYGEVFGITQHGGYIRAAHTYNSGSSTYFDCFATIGAVSQTGKFFAWSSDWLTTLGKDDKGVHRCDVFVVNLAAPQGAKN